MEFTFIGKNEDGLKIVFEFESIFAEEILAQFIDFLKANGYSIDDLKEAVE